MQPETSPLHAGAIDTNEEYIIASNAAQQPPVLGSIFRSIFIETPKDFFSGIIGFFVRYITHFMHGFLYFWKPSLRVPPFDSKDFKEDSQRTFEFALIATAILIFLIKQDLVPVNEQLQEQYGNDVLQMLMEFFIFLVFGVFYLVTILISVSMGRLLRWLFKLPMTKKEADILFSYFNNSLFSISVLIAFVFRCGVQFEEVANDEVFQNNVVGFLLILFLPVVILWSWRFAKLHNLPILKKIIFLIVSIAFFSIFFTFTSSQVTFFILGT